MTNLLEFAKRNPFLIFINLMMLISLVGLVTVILGYASAWWFLAGIIWAKIAQVMGHNVGLHRYYAHRSFKTTEKWQAVIAFFSVFCGIAKPIHYVYNHRRHHKYSDTDQDPHHPGHGRLRAIFGWWIIQGPEEQKFDVPFRDAIADKYCWNSSKYYFQIWTVALIIAAIFYWQVAVFILAFGAVFNFLDVGLFLVYLGHSWGKHGYQNFPEKSTTFNNTWAQIWTMGDGLHNNHHKWPGRYRKDIAPGEFDFTGLLIERVIMNKPTSNAG
jgi:fatty-acid desaturase